MEFIARIAALIPRLTDLPIGTKACIALQLSRYSWAKLIA
jgi:hypothetical protein